jgi:translation initiation factor eIF-2B subunit delta
VKNLLVKKTSFERASTKIVCGATAIFQNGVVLSEPGTQFLALLAYEFGIPFIVFCETYRYCDVSLLDGDLKEHEGTLYDLINPKYISMLITEAGPITVCSIPTLVSALYGL